MRTILVIAWRSIWRNPRRTWLSMGAVGIGLVLVIVYGGLLAGITAEAKEQLDSVGMGHVELSAPGWRAHRRVTEAVAAPEALLASLALPEGAEAGWRVVARALASSAHGSEGVELQGVDFAREARLSVHVRDVREGAVPEAADERGILVGEELARRLQLKVGAKLRVMVARADGEMTAELFRVRGVFHSPSPAISLRRVLVGEAAARRLLGVGDVAHQLVVQLERAADAEALAARLRGIVGARVEVASYGDLLPLMRMLDQLGDTFIWVMAVFVYSLVGLGIVNTMLMSVLERTREFGVLRAIGTRPGRVVAQVLGESFWIATLSGALGLAAGLAVTWYGSIYGLMDVGGGKSETLDLSGTVISALVKTKFDPVGALQAASLVYVMALLTGIYPAWRVAKLPPAAALRSS